LKHNRRTIHSLSFLVFFLISNNLVLSQAGAEDLGGELFISTSLAQSNQTFLTYDVTRDETLPQNREYQSLREMLGDSYEEGDSYADDYADYVPNFRFAEYRSHFQDYVLIDNLRFWVQWGKTRNHDIPIWSSALIDISKVKSATVLVNKFITTIGEMDIPAGHSQTLFEFEEGGVLTPYGQVGGIYISYEAMRKKDQAYSALGGGIKGEYEGCLLIGTRQDIFHKNETSAGVELIELELKKEQVQNLLRTSLFKAFEKERLKSLKYHTFKRSCITVQFDLISMGTGVRVSEWDPNNIYHTLDRAGLARNYTYLEAPTEVWQYALTHFSEDAQVPLDPTDMVLRPTYDTGEGSRKPFFGLTF